MYTRDGNFGLSKEGYLVTQDGDFVLNSNGSKITLDPTKTTKIDSSGNIYQADKLVDKVQITDFADYNYLQKYGEDLYSTAAGASKQTSSAQVTEGYLETSNVQTVSEMVQMIDITRDYQTNQKVIQTIDNTLQVTANQIGKL